MSYKKLKDQAIALALEIDVLKCKGLPTAIERDQLEQVFALIRRRSNANVYHPGDEELLDRAQSIKLIPEADL